MGGGCADYNDWIIRVTITDKVVSLITTHCNVYLKQVYVIKFFSVLLHRWFYSGYPGFLNQKN